MAKQSLFTDERGVSTTVAFALNLTLAAMLISGLLFAAGGVVENQRQTAIREELDVIGQRLAYSMQQANRTASLDTAPGATTVLEINVSTPQAVAGTDYTIEVDAGARELILKTDDPTVVVTVPLTLNTSVLEDGTVRGGHIAIVLTADGDFEVRNP